jgi:hypothetical protein
MATEDADVRAAGLAALLALPLAAQTKLTGKSFLPPDYTNVVSVDLAAMRALGIWDDIEASVLKVAFKAMEKELGWPLANLDRITAVAVVNADAADMAVIGRDLRQVFVLEGNAPLALSPATQQHGAQETIGEYQVRVRHGSDQSVYVNPRPELQVWGSRGLIAPVLEGTPSNGQPAADLMSLLSGRGDTFAYFVFDTRSVPFRQRFVVGFLGEAGWPDDDFPQFLSVRVRAIGKKDDPRLQVDAVLRHAKAGAGLQATEKAVKAWLTKSAADPRFAAMKSLWSKVEVKMQAGDLVVGLDLGRSRDAVGALTALALPIIQPAATPSVEDVAVPAGNGK